MLTPEQYTADMNLHLLTNPYFLGYAALIALVWLAGTGVKHMALQADARRKKHVD
jgi:hypothetical protein